MIEGRISGYFQRSEVKTAVLVFFGPKFAGGGGIAPCAFPPHPPEGAPAVVGVGRFGRGEVSEGRKVTSDLFVSNRADRFHSVYGCFRIFLRGARPWEVVFGPRGCKIRVPTPTRADLAGYNNFG